MTSRTTTSSSSRIVTSSSGGGEEEHGGIYRPKTMSKSVIVQRGSGGGFGRRSMFGGMGGGSSFSTRMSASFSPQVYSQMANTGIADYRDTRQREKQEMQDCNERLATYIEKVRWLEAKNKQLEAENEALRKRKQEDWRPIRDMYEGELQQAREVIKELSTQKGVSEAKLAGLQDEIESLRDLIAQHESHAKDYAKKIDQLNQQLGEYEGELNTLRLRCGSLEDEAAKLRALVNKYKEENARLRADLDAETAAHIEQEVLAQTRAEEIEFLTEMLDKIQSTTQEPVTVKGMDMEQFFKGELRQAVQSMQQAYDEQVNQMSMECEAKVASQVNQLKSGNVRDTMEAEHARSEVKRLRDQLAERNARIAALEAELATMRVDRDRLAAENNEMSLKIDTMQAEFNRKIADLQAEVEGLLAHIQMLIDAKMSLELEIACYRKLLEGEENRTGLRQLVEQTIGIRGGGASQIADIIGGGGSSSSTTQMQIQKTRTGMMGIKQVDPTGGQVDIELDLGARQNQDLKNMRLVKKVRGSETVSVDLGQCQMGQLEPGKILSVFATGKKSRADNKNEHVAQGTFSFGTGAGEFCLVSPEGKTVATYNIREM